MIALVEQLAAVVRAADAPRAASAPTAAAAAPRPISVLTAPYALRGRPYMETDE